MSKTLCALLLLAGAVSTANAEPRALAEAQPGAISAGPVGGPVGPAPIVPPVTKPGGPVLITCVVNVGCTTRPVGPEPGIPPVFHPGGPDHHR